MRKIGIWGIGLALVMSLPAYGKQTASSTIQGLDQHITQPRTVEQSYFLVLSTGFTSVRPSLKIPKHILQQIN